MKFTVLGCGRWGSFISWYLNHNGNDVLVWGREGDPLVESLFATRENEYVKFDDKIGLTNDLKKALNHAEVVIISISSQGLRGLIRQVLAAADVSNKTFILCMKGIEESTGTRLSEVLAQEGINKQNIAVWVGPGHIQEFTRHVPNCMVIDSNNQELSKKLIPLVKSDLIRFYLGDDIVGSEIGAAAKNVMGIAAGMLDGMGYPVLKGALMARGAREIARLIAACGGNEMSAYGLCHLGDYEATLFSEHSNNRRFGENFIKHIPFVKLAEGVSTASALLKMAKPLGVELPITTAVNDVIQGKIEPKEMLTLLFSREGKSEFTNKKI